MGLAPETFWAMTLPEWRAASNGFFARPGARGVPPLDRARLTALMRAHPDRT